MTGIGAIRHSTGETGLRWLSSLKPNNPQGKPVCFRWVFPILLSLDSIP